MQNFNIPAKSYLVEYLFYSMPRQNYLSVAKMTYQISAKEYKQILNARPLKLSRHIQLTVLNSWKNMQKSKQRNK